MRLPASVNRHHASAQRGNTPSGLCLAANVMDPERLAITGVAAIVQSIAFIDTRVCQRPVGRPEDDFIQSIKMLTGGGNACCLFHQAIRCVVAARERCRSLPRRGSMRRMSYCSGVDARRRYKRKCERLVLARPARPGASSARAPPSSCDRHPASFSPGQGGCDIDQPQGGLRACAPRWISSRSFRAC